MHGLVWVFTIYTHGVRVIFHMTPPNYELLFVPSTIIVLISSCFTTSNSVWISITSALIWKGAFILILKVEETLLWFYVSVLIDVWLVFFDKIYRPGDMKQVMSNWSLFRQNKINTKKRTVRCKCLNGFYTAKPR